MRVIVSTKTMIEALEKGGMAALLKEAQEDTSNMEMYIKSVKITADKELICESGNPHVLCKFSVPASEENGVIIKEKGSVVIPANEFKKFISSQRPDSLIALSFKAFETPEVVEAHGDEFYDESNATMIEKTGVVKMVAKSSEKSKTINQTWELECLNPDKFLDVKTSEEAMQCFEIDTDYLNSACFSVGFSVMQKDYEHIWDNVSVQVDNGNLYFLASDGLRCSVCKIREGKYRDIESEETLLIPGSPLEKVSKVLDPQKSTVFYYDDESNQIHMKNGDFTARIVCVDKEKKQSFPPISKLLEKRHNSVFRVSIDVLTEMLKSVSIVNEHAVALVVKKEKNMMAVYARSEEGRYRPTVKQTEIEEISNDEIFILNAKKTVEGLKIFKTNEVDIKISETKKSLQILSCGELEERNEPLFYISTIDNHLYQNLVK